MSPFREITGEHKAQVEERQKREVEGDHEFIVRTRAEDRSLLVRASYVLDKYKAIIWLLGSILLALGFDFKTPAQSYKALQDQITVLQKTHSGLDAERASTNAKLDALITIKCLEAQDYRDLTMARIDCNDYIRYGRRENVQPQR